MTLIEKQAIADKLVDLIFDEHRRYFSPIIIDTKQLSKKLTRFGKKPSEWKDEIGHILTECMAIKFRYCINDQWEGSSGFVHAWTYVAKDEDTPTDYFVVEANSAFMEIFKAAETVKLILDERRKS